MSRYIRAIVVICAMAFNCQAATEAEPSQATAIVLKMASLDIAPFAGRDLPNEGLIVALTREIFSQEGIKLEISYFPSQRIRSIIAEGEVAGYLMATSASRLPEFLHTDSFLNSRLLVLTHNKTSIKSLAALKESQQPLYEVRGWGVNTLVTGYNWHTVQTLKQCVLMTASERIDFCVVEQFAFYQLASEYPELIEKVRLIDQSLAEVPFVHAFAENQPLNADYIIRFNQRLGRWKAQGLLDAYIQDYLQKLVKQPIRYISSTTP